MKRESLSLSLSRPNPRQHDQRQTKTNASMPQRWQEERRASEDNLKTLHFKVDSRRPACSANHKQRGWVDWIAARLNMICYQYPVLRAESVVFDIVLYCTYNMIVCLYGHHFYSTSRLVITPPAVILNNLIDTHGSTHQKHKRAETTCYCYSIDGCYCYKQFRVQESLEAH